jgi:hypothetical protein
MLELAQPSEPGIPVENQGGSRISTQGGLAGIVTCDVQVAPESVAAAGPG